MRTRLHLGSFGALALLLVLAVATPGATLGALADSPVADAAMRGDADTVRALLREGADVNAAQGDGLTAIHWAALNGDVATLEVLIYAGAVLEPTTRLGGYTPLHLSSRQGEGGIVTALLEAGADAARFTDTGVTALHLAAQSGSADAVSALIEHGADVDARDTASSRTPLMYATAANRLEAIETLIGAGADVSLETAIIDFPARARRDNEEQGIRRRIKAAENPPERAARRPPTAGPPAAARGAQAAQAGQTRTTTPPDPDDPPARGGNANTTTPPDPDDPPARGGNANTATPPDPDDPPARGGSTTTPPDPDDPPSNRPTPPAADPNVPRSLSNTDQIGLQGGFTALHYASRDGRKEAADLLLAAGADLNHLTGGDESSPMLVAIINGNFDLAKHFLDLGADPNLASEDGAAPLFAVLNNEWQLRTWYPQPTASQQQEITYLELMRALLEAGADPNKRTNSHIWYAAYNAGRMGVDFTGATAFWRAAYATDVAAMRLLVEYGADPNISTMKLAGRSRFGRGDDGDPSGLDPVPPGGPHVHPLHAATGVGFGTSRVGQQHRHVPDGWLPAATYLVEELGVDVNVRDADGYSAVHNAAARGDNAVIELLVEHGADVTFVSRRGQTTVDMANGPQQRVQPFPETIALLEGLGAINNHNCISCD